MDQTVKRDFINTFLDSPIIIGPAERLYLILDNRAPDVTYAESKKLKEFQKVIPSGTEFVLYTPRDLEELKTLIPVTDTDHVETTWNSSYEIATSLHNGCLSQLSDATRSTLVPCVPTKDPDSLLYLRKCAFFKDFIGLLSCQKAKGSKKIVSLRRENQSLIGDQYGVCWMFHDDGFGIVMPYEAVTMWKDMLWARSNTLEAISVVHDGNEELRDFVIAAWQWCETCLTRYGNKGYEILKAIEPLCKAYAIHMVDPVFNEFEAFTRLQKDVESKEKKLFDTFDSSCTSQAQQLKDILSKASEVNTVIELFGLQKMTGHPLIDPRTGGRSSAEEASAPKKTSHLQAQRLRNNWCRLYVEGFVAKTGRWPPLIFPPTARHTRLYQLYALRERLLTKTSYPLTDWNNVRFERHAEFNYHDNFLDLMDDKSISFYLSEFRATWRKSVKTRSHKRLLLEMLARSEVNIRAIVDAADEGAIPEDWLIVSLYPKEREFKLSARMFSMMVFEMRAFFACLEDNLATHVFPYMPQQTMTLDKTAVSQLFHSATKPSALTEELRLFLEIDLTRWNLRWRDLPIRMIGEDLNDIFGKKRVYTVIHEFFTRCLIVVRVLHYEPEGLDQCPPPASDLLWYNHEGGFEGIAQKHWTLATYSMIDLGLSEYDVKYQLIGQADNQIILCHLPRPLGPNIKQHLTELTARMKQSIELSCLAVGQEAKPDECLESTSLVTYSKDFYVHGVLHHMSLKALSRIFPRGMSELPTIHNCVSALASGCVAAAERTNNPFRVHFMMLLHISRFLLLLPYENNVASAGMTPKGYSLLNKRTICRILCTPNSLGGLSIPGPLSFLYKGGSDQLCKDLAGLKFQPSVSSSYLNGVIETLLSGKWTDSTHRFATILQDPYSLPISTIPLVETRLQSNNLDKINHATANRAIKEIVSADMSIHESDLIDSMLAVRPFNPALLSDVIKNSSVGTKTAISKMFTSTRTIQSLPNSEHIDPGSIIMRGSAAQFAQVVARLGSVTRSTTDYLSHDVYTLAERLRNLWTRTTMPDSVSTPPPVVGLSTYCPVSWDMRFDDYCQGSLRSSINVSVDPSFTMPNDRQGPNQPYIGTRTQEKRSNHGYKIVTSSSADSCLAQLYKIMTQPGVNSSFQQLVSTIASSRSDISLLDLVPYSTQAVGGTIAHRYSSSMGLQTASILGSCNFSSYTSFQTDYAGILSASTADYPVMFQEFFVAGIGLLNLIAQSSGHPKLFLSYIVPSHLAEIPADELQSFRPLQAPVPIYSQNTILYTPDLRLLRQERPQESSMTTRGSIEDRTEHSQLVESYVRRALRKGGTGLLLADGKDLTRLRLNLDVLECKGLGVTALIEGSARALASLVVTALFTRTNSSHFWAITPLIKIASQAVARPWTTLLSHPAFHRDEYVQTCIRPSSLVYSRRGQVDRLSSIIGTRVYELLFNDHFLVTSHSTLFLDDEESASVDVGLNLIRSRLLASCQSGELSHQDALMADRRITLKLLSQEKTTESRGNALYDSCQEIRRIALETNKIQLQVSMENLGSGTGISLHGDTLVSQIRTTRLSSRSNQDIARWIAEQTGPLPRSTVALGPPRNFIPFDYATTLRYKTSRVASYSLFLITRASQRRYGSVPATVGSFWPARRAFECDSLIVLGSGNGGAALVGTLCGVRRVIVHDLKTDLDPACWGIDDHGVPCLRRVPRECTVERSYSGYTGGLGSVFDDSTWKDLTVMCPSSATVVIDVPINSRSDLSFLTSKMVVFYPKLPLITRWICQTSEESSVASEMNLYADIEHVYVVSQHYGWSEIVIKSTPRSSPLSVTEHLDVHSVCDPPADDKFQIGFESPLVTDYGDLNKWATNPDGSSEHLGVSLHADLQRSVHGYTSAQWTRVLHFLFLKRVSTMTFDDGIQYLGSVVNQTEVPTVDIGSRSYPIAYSSQFSTLVLRTAPLCLPE